MSDSMSSGAFSLRDVLHAAVETTADPSPAAVAETAFEAVDPADYGEALRQALDMLAQSYVTETRPTRRTGRKGTTSKRKRTPAAVTQAVHAFLESREFSPFRNAWIRLSEVTVEDAESIAQARYALAEQVNAKGDWWTRVAKEISDSSGNTFGDLPEAVVEELMVEEEEEE